MNKTETGVVLPEDSVITVEWAREQLSRVDLFSASLLAYGRGEIMFMLQTNLSPGGFEQSISELGYTIETANTYISYLQKRAVLEAIREKYYVALSLSAAEYIPDNTEDAIALCDICLARFGKLTAENLRKAAEASGTLPKKMSAAAISVEAMKKKALHDWLLSEHQMSDDDILQAGSIDTSGKTEFLEKMLQAYSLLTDWKDFYNIIAEPIHNANNPKALRFLADMQDASLSVEEFLQSEAANHRLARLKATFDNEVYPKMSFEASKSN